MKLVKIEIENYRSIKQYSFEVNSSTVFIGKNNHGKTNLFSALDWFDSGKTKIEDYPQHKKEKTIKVSLHFIEAQSTLTEMSEGGHKTKLKKLLNGADSFIVTKSSEDDKRYFEIEGKRKTNPGGFDSALNYFLPKMVYVTTKDKLTDIASYKSKSPISEMLSSVLEDLAENDPDFGKFLDLFDKIFNHSDSMFRRAVSDLEKRVENHLETQFPLGAKVKFQIEKPEVEDMLKKFTTLINDGVETRAEEKGDGMQRAVILAIVRAYADYRRDNKIAKNFIFLIDEAELHLHPTAQRLLKDALKEITQDNAQVLVSSHSSVFVNENISGQLIYRIEKKESHISELTPILTGQEKIDAVYNLLGGSPVDILLPSNFLIVEGECEKVFLQGLVSRFYSEDPSLNRLKIVKARGDAAQAGKELARVSELYMTLDAGAVYRDRVVVLLDLLNDQQKIYYETIFCKNFPNFKESAPTKRCYFLPTHTLEESYPAPYQKTEAEVKKMSDNDKVCLAQEVIANITQQEFEAEMPIMLDALKQAGELGFV